MNKFALSLLLLFTSLAMCCAQNDFRKSFSDFATSTRQQYEEYSKKANEEFSKALQENWRSFKVFDAKVRIPFKPASDTLVEPCPLKNEQIDISDVPVDYKRTKAAKMATNSSSAYESGVNHGDLKTVAVDFYGAKIKAAVPVNYFELRLDSQSERSVSRFWGELSRKGCEDMVNSVKKVQKELNLNDWGLFEYVGSLSSALFQDGSTDEKAVFTVFCMNQMGYNSKVARTETALVAIFASEQEIYGRQYVIVDDVKYYLANAAGKVTSLKTYSPKMEGTDTNLDMNVVCNPKLGDGNGTIHKVKSSVFNSSFSLPINNSLITFYGDYPQLDVNIYAGAEPDGQFADAISGSIRPMLHERSGIEALNTLLAFVQKDFRYKTDIEQFGKEKPFFCEENFYYPYNDCEDRAVLFTFLVRKVLGYDCLLLQYSDHINCAVRIDGDADGYYVKRNGSKYYVCDPTCQGAKVGMSGKDYRIKPERIWVL